MGCSAHPQVRTLHVLARRHLSRRPFQHHATLLHDVHDVGEREGSRTPLQFAATPEGPGRQVAGIML